MIATFERTQSSGSSAAALQPATAALMRRIQLFEQEKARQQTLLSQSSSAGEVIAVSPSLSEPLVRQAGWAPIEALKHMAKGDDNQPVVAVRVNGMLQGLHDRVTQPGRVELEFVRFGDGGDGTRVFWHSAAHIVGASLEAFFGNRVQLCDGPPLIDAEGGFFYEMHLLDDAATPKLDAGGEADIPGLKFISSSGGKGSKDVAASVPLVDSSRLRITEGLYAPLEGIAKKLTAGKFPFERLEVSREFATQLFESNPFKLDMLGRIPAGEAVSLYRCGPFVDLCRGPHVPHTGVFKALRLFKSSGSHWMPQQQPQQQQLEGAQPQQCSSSAPSKLVGGELLQRVYGIAFPTSAQLSSWQAAIDEAKKRDHRAIGKAQLLFFFHDLSPGSAFMLPHGTRIYNCLVALLRREYRRRGYNEVMSPLMYKADLWRTSGHLDAYAENMFTVTQGMTPDAGLPVTSPAKVDEDKGCGHDHHHYQSHGAAATPSSLSSAEPAIVSASAVVNGAVAIPPLSSSSLDASEVFGLKPMNCPGHCLIFAHRGVSYRELPVRLADFSSLHRNEASGALGGLTRLRRFQQDDAHIFCSEEQIGAEVHGCLDFVRYVYGLFDMSFRAKLSTRPEKYVGDIATWDRAEAALHAALAAEASSEDSGNSSTSTVIEIDHGGGAFYGPKIDIFVRDALGREHQCATVQLDFQLPRRFGLSYGGPEGQPRTPVIIHRAILGSLERMMVILIEHTGGKWPFWLSPRQVMVAPVAERHVPYARHVADQLRFPPLPRPAGAAAAAASAPSTAPGAQPQQQAALQANEDDDGALLGDSGLWVDVDESDRTVPKKVREAQVAQYNLILVVGDKEAADGTVTVRFRDAPAQDAFYSALRRVDPSFDSCSAQPAKSEGAAASSAAAAVKDGTSTPAPAAAALLQLPVGTLREACDEICRRFL